MSITDYGTCGTEFRYPAVVKWPTANRPLHRLGKVRRQQEVSLHTMAQRLGTPVSNVKWQEQERADLLLSKLYQWQKVLDVPVAELLVEPEESLSPPVMKRARMVRLMKTVAAILERNQDPAIERLAQMMADQLIEIMPELEGVGPWNAVGQRRTMDDLGQAARRCISLEILRDLVD